jgi:hypothetical protein
MAYETKAGAVYTPASSGLHFAVHHWFSGAHRRSVEGRDGQPRAAALGRVFVRHLGGAVPDDALDRLPVESQLQPARRKGVAHPVQRAIVREPGPAYRGAHTMAHVVDLQRASGLGGEQHDVVVWEITGNAVTPAFFTSSGLTGASESVMTSRWSEKAGLRFAALPFFETAIFSRPGIF